MGDAVNVWIGCGGSTPAKVGATRTFDKKNTQNLWMNRTKLP